MGDADDPHTRRSCPDHVPGPEQVPPQNADDWTDEQWLAWLRATDAGGERPSDQPAREPLQRLTESTGGQILGQAMLGLSNAIYGRRDEDLIVVEDASGDPPGDDDLEVKLDPAHPERSQVIVRRRGGHRA